MNLHLRAALGMAAVSLFAFPLPSRPDTSRKSSNG